MNAEWKKKWVEGLRSGKYKQGTGRLHDMQNDTFCCLGVLCDLVKPVWTKFYPNSPSGYWNDDTGYWNDDTTNAAYLPDEVLKLTDLQDENPKIPSKNDSLSILNDINYTFEQIADLIEAEL